MLSKIHVYLYRFISIVFTIIFLPILFCTIVWGNSMNYYEYVKVPTLLDNKLIFLLCLVCIGFLLWVLYFCRKLPPLTRRGNIVLTIFLLLTFTVIYFINELVAKQIVFFTGWDPSIVSGTKVAFGGHSYFSMYPNNIMITYSLRKLYEKVEAIGNYPHNIEFVWIQMNCLGISVAGFFTCTTVKKLTNHLLPTLLSLGIFVACVCVTPWKVIPYTDMYAIVYPIVCICLYIYACNAKHNISRYLLFLIIYALGVMGAMMKASVYIPLIAIIILETIHFLQNRKLHWKLWLWQLIILFFAIVLSTRYTEKICNEMLFVPNTEIAASWHHYFLMGLNEETTGGYYSPDVALFGEYQFRPQKERQQEELRLAMERLKEKGVIGYPYFLLRKMVMTFNDGTFGWGLEGGFYSGYYPADIARNDEFTQLLRNIFWGDRIYTGRFNTYSQSVWLLILCCIPGLICWKNKNREQITILLTILGILLFQMLFETRARYLICFLPVFMVAAATGIWNYYQLFEQKFILKKN